MLAKTSGSAQTATSMDFKAGPNPMTKMAD